MTHTPGPWKFEGPTNTIRSVPANYWLATMDSWDGAVDNAANARLIAAAPDLLEALQGVLRVADRKTAEFDAARAAIAKATGERH